MANLELGKTSSPIYSFQFDALAAVANNGNAITSTNVSATATSIKSFFYPGVSRVLGIVKTTAGGVSDKVMFTSAVVQNSTTNGSLVQLKLTANNATDTSVYTVYWSNEVGSSQILSVIPC